MARADNWNTSYGDDSPVNDVYIDTWEVGNFRINTNATTQATGLFGWYCSVAGHPGTWVPMWGSAGGSAGLPRVAGIYTGATTLTGLSTSGYSTTQAHVTEVLSVGDFFKFDPTTVIAAWSSVTAYVVGDLVTNGGVTFVAVAAGTNHVTTDRAFWFVSMIRIGSTGAAGSWVRMGIVNPYWQKQTTWSLDPSNASTVASDENAGLTDGAPLYTWGEFLRRLGPATKYGTTTVTIRLLSDTLLGEKRVDLSQFTMVSSGSQNIAIRGVETVLFSGTLTAVSTQPWSVADSSIATSWTASGGVSSSTGTRIIQKTSGNIRAIITADLGSKTAQISPPTDASAASPGTSGLITAFTVGDAYQVISIPKAPAFFNLGANLQIRPVYCDIGAAGDTFSLWQQCAGNPRLCGFRFACIFQTAVASFVTACYFGNTASFTGPSVVSHGSVFMSTSQWSGGIHDMNGLVNEFRDTLSILHGNSCHMGTAWCFGVGGTRTAIRVGHSSQVEFAAIRGSGNTGLILDVSEPGCSVAAPVGFSQFDATTSFAHAIQICGDQFDWTDLPIFRAHKNAGVFG